MVPSRVLHTRAFSLVELSIVLVILGLLVGGILAGQSLIRASELRAVTAEFDRYVVATRAFRNKYMGLPGDILNATDFWGTAGACPGTTSTGSTTPATCNGNGNGQLQVTFAGSNETFRYWQQLANAGLIEGTYTGVSALEGSPLDLYSALGSNVPRSKLSNAGWAIYHLGTITESNLNYYGANYGNIFFYGAQSGYTTYRAALPPEEAWNIDTKIDDGKVATGMVTGIEFQGGISTPCGDLAASASSLAHSTYVLNDTRPNCALIFKTGF